MQSDLRIGAVFVGNRSHKGVHVQLAFFDNEAVVAVGRDRSDERSGVGAGREPERKQRGGNKFFHFAVSDSSSSFFG